MIDSGPRPATRGVWYETTIGDRHGGGWGIIAKHDGDSGWGIITMAPIVVMDIDDREAMLYRVNNWVALVAERDGLRLRADMACENPPEHCECPGCRLAAEANAAADGDAT